MTDLIKLRRDTAANWTSVNPTLSAGEAGYESDTKRLKVGDGSTAWTSLGYVTNSAPVVATRTSGNITVGSTSWVALDSGLDITIPAATGDVVEVGCSYVAGDTNAAYLFFDFGTVVSGSVVNRWGGSEGISGLITVSGSRDGKGLSMPRALVSGDISSGTVTLRLLASLPATTPTRLVKADTYDPLVFWAKNHSR